MIETIEELIRFIETDDSELNESSSWEEAPEILWHELLLKYCDDPDMRFAVTLNKTLPTSVLMVLAKDDSWRVRCTVAKKRRLEPSIRELLSKDENEAVRRGIAYNQKTPREILAKMVNDPVPDIAERVRKRLAES
ncbi:MAG: hypothetical protein ABIR47_09425 [Candidatus Kapaibacterium sp.]